MDPIKVGLIGYGYAGATFHAPLISAVAGLRLACIASSSTEKVRQDFSHAEVVAHPDGVIGAADVSLIVIASPNTTHYTLAKQALLANKHVVLEKPFTVTVAEAMELVRLAEERKLLLSVFHNRRWDNDFLTVRACIESGMLGEINTYEAHFDRYRPDVRNRWREQDLPGSGSLYDLGSHLIDQALVLFGMPDTVSADLGTQRAGGKANDYFHLVLSYGARRIILHSGMLVMDPGPHFQVHGSKGSFIKYGMDPQEEALKQGCGPGDASWGLESETLHGKITLKNSELSIAGKVKTLPGAYQAYYQGMLDAIRNGGPTPVSAVDALNVIRVIETAIASSNKKCTLNVIACPTLATSTKSHPPS